MPEDLIVRYCAPTLGGLKPASLFSYPYEEESSLLEEVNCLNQDLQDTGYKIRVIGYTNRAALIYIYSDDQLIQSLNSDDVQEVLSRFGYDCHCLEEYLDTLQSHLKQYDVFPHEIGLFLGYPVEDVVGFIEKKQIAYTGLWRVYGNVEAAKKRFQAFDECTTQFQLGLESGFTIRDIVLRRNQS